MGELRNYLCCRKAQAGREIENSLAQSTKVSPRHRDVLKIAKPSQHILYQVVSSIFSVKGCTSLLLVRVQQALSKTWVLGDTLAWWGHGSALTQQDMDTRASCGEMDLS